MLIKSIYMLSILLVFMMLSVTMSVQAADNSIVVITPNDNIEKALNVGKDLLIKNGEYVLTSLASISSDVIITGENNTVISGDKKFSLSMNGLNNVEFKNIKFINFNAISLKNSKNIKFTNCQFDGFVTNGIYMDSFDNVEFNNCILSNMGSTKVDVTWQGMGLYTFNGENLKIYNTELYEIYGHAAIFLTNTSFEIYNNKIHDTFYRGVELYKSGNSGVISDNNIYNIGAINTSNSGIGCNGIYSNHDSSNVIVQNNTISNMLENGIEGNYKIIKNNTIDGTGIDIKNHLTPSTEGIYIWGSSKVIGNIIKNSYKAGIKSYSINTISDIDIKGNLIYDTINSDYAIDINSEKGYLNINITDNIAYNIKYSVYLRDKQKVNVYVSNNIVKTE